MRWDVFVSYASEDKQFVRQLVRGLIDSGLQVWFDEFALEAGDGLRRSIDKGLRESKYGVVVLSPDFFRKEWPQRELDGLTARDDGKSKVIIPVWYKVSAEEVRAYSLPLADKLSVYYSGSVRGVVSKLLRAIQKDRFADSHWKPQFIETSSGLVLSVLPFRPFLEKRSQSRWRRAPETDRRKQAKWVLSAGRFLVTNAEYGRFIQATGHPAPIGEHFVNDEWVGPFSPWQDARFSSPDMPVVCVDFWNAVDFCKWASSPEMNVFLPTAELWDYLAAEGRLGINVHKALGVIEPAKIHDRATEPATTDRAGNRSNTLGISDLFGNVWEWCGGNVYEQHLSAVKITGSKRFHPIESELRGGGFLDDLRLVHPALRSGVLEDGTYTRHTDVGFRVCAAIQIDQLSAGVLAIMETLPSVPLSIADTALDSDFFYEEIGTQERQRQYLHWEQEDET